jgi:hypothetical protein
MRSSLIVQHPLFYHLFFLVDLATRRRLRPEDLAIYLAVGRRELGDERTGLRRIR